MSPWDLMKEGRFPEAADSYSAALCDDPSPFNYYNRALASLNLGKLDSALDDFATADRLDRSKGDAARQRIGVVHWLAGREGAAIEVWDRLVRGSDATEIAYTDAAGGVGPPSLLWFASIRRNDLTLQKAAAESLRNVLKSKRREIWPGPLGQFILGRVDFSTVMAATSSVPVLRERQHCQAEFFDAVVALKDGRLTEWIAGLRRASAMNDALLENELYLSRYELSRSYRDAHDEQSKPNDPV